ncbi:MAG: hypothetical protein ACJ8H8_15845, partial [Geminicoccaceae bacterium]
MVGVGGAEADVAAMASTTSEGDRLAVLHDGAEIRVPRRRTTLLSLPMAAADEESALRAAVQLGAEHTFVASR